MGGIARLLDCLPAMQHDPNRPEDVLKVDADEEGVGGDDHEPFLHAGVAAVDLIQLAGYPHWHKADDTIDKVSPQSMKIVGDTVLASLPKIVERLNKEQKEK